MSRFIHKEARIHVTGITEDARGHKWVNYHVDVVDEDDKQVGGLHNCRVPLGGEVVVLKLGDGRLAVGGHALGLLPPVLDWDDDEDEGDGGP